MKMLEIRGPLVHFRATIVVFRSHATYMAPQARRSRRPRRPAAQIAQAAQVAQVGESGALMEALGAHPERGHETEPQGRCCRGHLSCHDVP